MTKKQYEALAAKLESLDDIFGDLPDGAYFAVLAEHGIDVYDLVEMGDFEEANNIPKKQWVGAH